MLARPGNRVDGGEAAAFAAAAAEGKRSDVGLFLQNVIKGRKQRRRKAELLLPPFNLPGPVWSCFHIRPRFSRDSFKELGSD